MGDTNISWTDKTWGPVRGCSRVSEGCRNCYAERMAMRFAGPGQPYEGLVTKRLKVINADEPDAGNYVEAHWTGKVQFVEGKLADPIRWTKPCRIFVASMSDLFHEEFTNEQIAAVFGVMAACPQHTFQCLTKRPARMKAWFEWLELEAKTCNGGTGMTQASRCFVESQKNDSYFSLHGKLSPLRKGHTIDLAFAAPWPLPNVWLGVSTENQPTADERIPLLLATPAAIRFISAEPLLGPIDLSNVQSYDSVGGLDWVIAGCESGPRARRCDVNWIRSLRDQCRAVGVPFFAKQATRVDETDRFGQPAVHGQHTNAEGDPRSPKYKPGGVIERPYIDGEQHLAFPA